jgi:hypothetical protein
MRDTWLGWLTPRDYAEPFPSLASRLALVHSWHQAKTTARSALRPAALIKRTMDRQNKRYLALVTPPECILWSLPALSSGGHALPGVCTGPQRGTAFPLEAPWHQGRCGAALRARRRHTRRRTGHCRPTRGPWEEALGNATWEMRWGMDFQWDTDVSRITMPTLGRVIGTDTPTGMKGRQP